MVTHSELPSAYSTLLQNGMLEDHRSEAMSHNSGWNTSMNIHICKTQQFDIIFHDLNTNIDYTSKFSYHLRLVKVPDDRFNRCVLPHCSLTVFSKIGVDRRSSGMRGLPLQSLLHLPQSSKDKQSLPRFSAPTFPQRAKLYFLGSFDVGTIEVSRKYTNR